MTIFKCSFFLLPPFFSLFPGYCCLSHYLLPSYVPYLLLTPSLAICQLSCFFFILPFCFAVLLFVLSVFTISWPSSVIDKEKEKNTCTNIAEKGSANQLFECPSWRILFKYKFISFLRPQTFLSDNLHVNLLMCVSCVCVILYTTVMSLRFPVEYNHGYSSHFYADKLLLFLLHVHNSIFSS